MASLSTTRTHRGLVVQITRGVGLIVQGVVSVGNVYGPSFSSSKEVMEDFDDSVVHLCGVLMAGCRWPAFVVGDLKNGHIGNSKSRQRAGYIREEKEVNER